MSRSSPTRVLGGLQWSRTAPRPYELAVRNEAEEIFVAFKLQLAAPVRPWHSPHTRRLVVTHVGVPEPFRRRGVLSRTMDALAEAVMPDEIEVRKREDPRSPEIEAPPHDEMRGLREPESRSPRPSANRNPVTLPVTPHAIPPRSRRNPVTPQVDRVLSDTMRAYCCSRGYDLVPAQPGDALTVCLLGSCISPPEPSRNPPPVGEELAGGSYRRPWAAGDGAGAHSLAGGGADRGACPGQPLSRRA